ncbi:DNA helicase [Rhizobium halophytocola]|uniref:Replicative DNA helicase n=1 Tax=Rhizobium halophytocola TaxID=735519 RepID=A0ABS4DWK8_9HYPH|nr:DNA helicase [Rhizobium halophytocola]MBP1850088.1 replicative DNA helicase [Rhizobium halophytocola]
MALSAPIFMLKRKAKLMSRRDKMKLGDALDRVARAEGYNAWSHLAGSIGTDGRTQDLAQLARFVAGETVLIGARPGQGKTLFGLRLLIAAAKTGRTGAFFTLDYTQRDFDARLSRLGTNRDQLGPDFAFHDSDGINADYIIAALAEAGAGSIGVIDYLQLLDQRRDNPPLQDQIAALKAFARSSGVILVFISQIDRMFDDSGRTLPDLSDIRLPNHLDLQLFDKFVFLNAGETGFRDAA